MLTRTRFILSVDSQITIQTTRLRSGHFLRIHYWLLYKILTNLQFCYKSHHNNQIRPTSHVSPFPHPLLPTQSPMGTNYPNKTDYNPISIPITFKRPNYNYWRDNCAILLKPFRVSTGASNSTAVWEWTCCSNLNVFRRSIRFAKKFFNNLDKHWNRKIDRREIF